VPDGIFSNQEPKFGYILLGLAMVNVCIFCVHFVYLTAICHILWTFDIGIFPISVCCSKKKNPATLGMVRFFTSSEFWRVDKKWPYR
jgi:hypothetical protein